ncbi:MAG: hypothetical protein JXA30_12040 [Deltaproteobacteria bacterium]|nr:hypothetical protein [Deltaproteobacteria bacterium]
MLTTIQLARRAACEVRSQDRVYLGRGLCEGLESYLPPNVVIVRDGSSRVDVALLTATKVCGKGDFIQSPRVNGRNQSEWSPLPIRGSRQTVILVPHCSDQSEWLVDRCEKENGLNQKTNCRIITSLAVIDITDVGPIVREVASGVSASEVQQTTRATLLAGPYLKPIDIY